MSEERDNSGTLNRNEKKEKPTHADYKGKAMIDGTGYWLDAWIKEGPNGKFMSLAFKPRNPEAMPSKPRTEPPTPDNPEIPF